MTKHYVDTTSITHLSLCTGYGGIDLGLARVVSNLRTIAYCEREAAAIELLLSRMENGQLDAAPIWTDLRSFPWEAFSDRVDILSGGYPCQPFSAAGKRLGAEDERHLWPAIADGIRILRPRICFFENVEGHITLGLSTVISDLEELGYEVSWGIFSAAEVGAPHQRKRVFIMAYRCGEGLEGDIAGLLVPRGRQKPSRPTAGSSRSSGERGMADSNGTGSGEDWKSSEPRATRLEQSPCTQGRSDEGEAREKQVWPSRPGEPQHWWEPPRVVANTEFVGRRGRSDGDARGLCGEIQIARPCDSGAEPAVVDSEGKRSGGRQEFCQTKWGQERELSRESHQSGEILGDTEVPRLAQSGTDQLQGGVNAAFGNASSPIGAVGDTSLLDGSGQAGGQRQTQARRASAEWDNGQAEPTLGRGVDGPSDWVDYGELCVSCDNRTDELRMLGNGVCVPTAARAFVTLMEELL